MTIKERINAPSTKLGKLLQKWVSGFLLFCGALGAANEYLSLLPSDFIPTWIKVSVVVAGVISFVAGKLTVQTDAKV